MESYWEQKNSYCLFYCNLSLWKNCVKNSFSLYNALPVIWLLDVAIDNIYNEGIEKVRERHHTAAEYVRTRLMDMGVELYLKMDILQLLLLLPSRRIWLQRVSDYLLHNFEVMIAGSYSYLSNKVLRIGHMGEMPVSIDWIILKSHWKTLRILKNNICIKVSFWHFKSEKRLFKFNLLLYSILDLYYIMLLV